MPSVIYVDVGSHSFIEDNCVFLLCAGSWVVPQELEALQCNTHLFANMTATRSLTHRINPNFCQWNGAWHQASNGFMPWFAVSPRLLASWLVCPACAHCRLASTLTWVDATKMGNLFPWDPRQWIIAPLDGETQLLPMEARAKTTGFDQSWILMAACARVCVWGSGTVMPTILMASLRQDNAKADGWVYGSLLVLVKSAAKRLEGDWLEMSSISQRSRTTQNSRRSSGFISSHQLPLTLFQPEIPLRWSSPGHNCVLLPSSCQVSVPTTCLGFMAAAENVGSSHACMFASKECGGIKIRADPRKSVFELLLLYNNVS